MTVSVSIQNPTTLDIVFGCLTKIRSPMSLSSARAFHILLSLAMKSLLLILAVLAFDLKLAFGGPSGKFYMNIITL